MSSDHSEDESEPNAGASDEERLVGQSPAEADADDDAAEAQDDPSDPDAEPPGDGEDPFRPRPGVDLAQTLLHESVPPATSTIKRRYAYRTWFQLVVSLFIAYHGTILLVHNLPGKGLAKGVQKKLNQEPKLWPWKDRQFGLHAGHYWRATGNTQSWAMFAPNPHRSNIFMRVMVKDKDGEVWDLKHDIYGKRTYPYLWYDRMGKINRRIVDHIADFNLVYTERAREHLLTLWTDLPTHGRSSLYSDMFLRGASDEVAAIFDDPTGNVPARRSDEIELHLERLQGALGMTAADIGRVLEANGTDTATARGRMYLAASGLTCCRNLRLTGREDYAGPKRDA